VLLSALPLLRGLSLHFLKCLPPPGNFTEQFLGGMETAVEVIVQEELAHKTACLRESHLPFHFYRL